MSRVEDPATAELLADPSGWELHAALRLVAARAGTPPAQSVGVEDDAARIGQVPTLGFAAGEVRAARAAGGVIEIAQTAFGPFGPKGALPRHVTEDAALHAPDLGPFLDLFTHRMTWLLHRAWAAARQAPGRDAGGDDPWRRRIGALFGMGPEEFHDRGAAPDDLKLHLAGWLATGRGSVAAIRGVLGATLGAPVEVEAFRTEWLPIPAEERARLGRAPGRLGRDVVLGARAFSLQSRVRIRTAPLGFETFSALLPGGRLDASLRDMLRSVVGLALACELQPVLDAREAPAPRLDGARRLGRDLWLRGPAAPAEGALDDLVLAPESIRAAA